MNFQSAIYTGTIHHRRTAPKVHDFHYQIALFYLDLSEIKSVFNLPFFFSWRGPGVVGFRRKDYVKGVPDLKTAVQDLIFLKTGRKHVGPIRLLTQIRYFGFCFNPVSFYYCFNDDEELEFIVSEITNTPWNERYAYVHSVEPGVVKSRFEFKKEFHVSPFLPMDLHYVWNFNQPAPRDPASRINVHMEDWDLTSKTRVFEASLSLKAMPMTKWNLARTVLGYPLLTLKTGLAIYYQALRLKLKGTPFYSHPVSGEKI